MIYKNVEIYNAAEIKETEKGATWQRVPTYVVNSIDSDIGKERCINSTGVEIRFVMKSDCVTLKLEALSTAGVLNTFHIFYGGIQGGWSEHEVNKYVNNTITEIVISKPKNMETLHRMSEAADYDWSPEVVRIIFDRGIYRIAGIEGAVEPPKKDETPAKTILSYGSSITHGSNSIDASHAWTSVLAHNLNMDMRNLGMAGACRMEPAMIDYIALEGESNQWDIATLELGINVLDWEEDKINTHVYNTIHQIAGRNPRKPVFVISPFYCLDDFNHIGHAEKWRRLIAENVQSLNLKNVTYINGLDLLGDMSLISADEVHPNIYGVEQIAERLTEIIACHVKQNRV